jgi:hypothetical protein
VKEVRLEAAAVITRRSMSKARARDGYQTRSTFIVQNLNDRSFV